MIVSDRPIVFCGPTLWNVDLENYDEYDFRPPARSGDISKVVKEGAVCIVLIDGVFGDRQAVLHKEILMALSRGVRVFGTASLGALRAAECAEYGMNGTGKVFEDYSTGYRTRDSDVVVLHAPSEMRFQPLTIAQVDIDATLNLLVDQFTSEEISKIRCASEALHYSRRSLEGIVDLADGNTRMLGILKESFISQKMLDAVSFLSGFSILPRRKPDTTKSRVWRLNSTGYFREVPGWSG